MADVTKHKFILYSFKQTLGSTKFNQHTHTHTWHQFDQYTPFGDATQEDIRQTLNMKALYLSEFSVNIHRVIKCHVADSTSPQSIPVEIQLLQNRKCVYRLLRSIAVIDGEGCVENVRCA
jgi:hypothetical protein